MRGAINQKFIDLSKHELLKLSVPESRLELLSAAADMNSIPPTADTPIKNSRS